MRKDLIVDVIRIEHAVAIRCVQIDEAERKEINFNITDNKHYTRLKSVTCPEIGSSAIFVQGDESRRDNKIALRNFDTVKIAKEVVEDIKRLVSEYNKTMNKQGMPKETEIERTLIK